MYLVHYCYYIFLLSFLFYIFMVKPDLKQSINDMLSSFLEVSSGGGTKRSNFMLKKCIGKMKDNFR